MACILEFFHTNKYDQSKINEINEPISDLFICS